MNRRIAWATILVLLFLGCKSTPEKRTEINRLEDKAANMQVTILPAGVTAFVETNHPGYQIMEVGKELEGEAEIYEIEISNGVRTVALLFDAEGTFLRLEQDDDDHDGAEGPEDHDEQGEDDD